MLPIASFIFIAWQRSAPLGSSEIPNGDKLPRVHLFITYIKPSKKTIGMVRALSGLHYTFVFGKEDSSLIDAGQILRAEIMWHLLFFSWNVANGNKIHESLIPTGKWTAFGFGKLQVCFYFRTSWCYSWRGGRAKGGRGREGEKEKERSIQTFFFKLRRGRKWNENSNQHGGRKWDILPLFSLMGIKLNGLCWILQGNLMSARGDCI